MLILKLAAAEFIFTVVPAFMLCSITCFALLTELQFKAFHLHGFLLGLAPV